MLGQKAIVRIMPCSHMMCPLGAKDNFENLDGAQHQKPQFAIEEIKTHHVFKARSFERRPIIAQFGGIFKWQLVGFETKI